jgi:hypothetical protein
MIGLIFNTARGRNRATEALRKPGEGILVEFGA